MKFLTISEFFMQPEKPNFKSILLNNFDFFLVNFSDDLFIHNKRKEIVEEFNHFINEEVIVSDDYIFEFKEKINKRFFHNSKYHRLGENINFENNSNKVGHVVPNSGMANDLFKSFTDEFKKPNSNLSYFFIPTPQEIRELLNSNEKELLIKLKEEFGNFRIRQFQMWCFRNQSQKQSVFDNINLIDLPILLALEEKKVKGKLFVFEIEKPSYVDAFKPTIFDAGLDPLWRPGGKTCPNIREEGLEEMLIEKLNFKDVVKLMTISN